MVAEVGEVAGAGEPRHSKGMQVSEQISWCKMLQEKSRFHLTALLYKSTSPAMSFFGGYV